MARWAAAVLVGLLAGTAETQVVIESARWGFDGTMTPHRFNILTVDVANRGSQPFQGLVRLTQGDPLLAGAGARHHLPVFLSPGTSRQLRFYPYVTSTSTPWTVRVDTARLQFAQFVTADGVRVRPGTPTTVLLRPASALGAVAYGIPEFPDRDFPTTAAATGGLGRLILAHAPQWRPAQQQALVDWLRGGGQVDLLHDSVAFPVFEGALAILNDPRPAFAVGAGRVVKHPRPLQARDPLASQRPAQPDQDDMYSTAPTQNLFGALRRIVQAEHNWELLYVLMFLFFLAVVPGHALLTGRKLGYLGSIASLLTIVALFTWLIFEVGRRGYGESSAFYSVSHARVLDRGRFDVFQYKNLFSTTTRTQVVRHRATGSLYSAATDEEFVPGQVVHGADASFEVGVPLFTSRPFVHRGLVTGTPVTAEVRSWGSQARLAPGLAIAWTGPEVLTAFAIQGDSGVQLRPDGGVLVPASGIRAVGQLLRRSPAIGHELSRDSMRPDPATRLRKLLPVIVPEVLHDRWRRNAPATAPTTGRSGALRLLVVCPATDDFKIRTGDDATDVGVEHGVVIYELPIQDGD